MERIVNFMGLMEDLEVLEPLALKTIEELTREVRIGSRTFKLPLAGEGFNVFPRDLLTSAFMLRDRELLSQTLSFCVVTQGKGKDPYTGEEPGKILHELDATSKRGLNPKYNACDTTALFLIGVSLLNDDKFTSKNLEAINSALGYIYLHLNEDFLFYDDPRLSGAQDFALRATYWKDTEGLPLRAELYDLSREEIEEIDRMLVYEDGELEDYWRRTENLPVQRTLNYPATYTLVQAQVAHALKTTSRLHDLSYSRSELETTAERVAEAIFSKLWSDKLDFPKIAIDRLGDYEGIASDGIHMLWYLREFRIDKRKLSSIYVNAEQLVTPYGYRSYSPTGPSYSPYSYHWGAIWSYEQYFISEAALMHGQVGVVEKCLRIVRAFKELRILAECFHYDGRSIKPAGKRKQLWSAATIISLANEARNNENFQSIINSFTFPEK